MLVCERTDIAAAKWAKLSTHLHVTIAAATKDQFHWPGSSFDLYKVAGHRHEVFSIQRLKYQFEASVIERRAGRFLDLLNPFSQSLLRQLKHAMMAIRIVAGLAE